MELRELLTDIDHNLISGDSSVQVSGVSYDSRLSGPGDLFVALPSASHNPEHGVAHNLKSAFTAGVRSFVINQADQPAAAPLLLDDAASEDTVTVLTVADTRQALAMISRRWFGFPERELKVVALTGTKGKTTISYMLADMADAAGVPLGLIGSNGIIFGDEHLKLPNTTPESYEIHKTLRLMADAHMAVAVIETTSQGFKLHRTDGLEFDLGVYTNISNDHVSPTEHPTFEDYFACKEQIFDQAKLCFVNRDAAMFDQIVAAANPSCTIATYGETDAADIWADGVTAATTVGDMTTSFNCHWASTNESGGLGATTLAPYDAAGLATPATPGSPTTTDNAGTATPATPVSIPFTANHPGTPGALGTTATEPGAPGASGSPTTTETDHSGTATEPTAPATPVSIPFTMSLPGEFNVSNALAAISVGRALGWPIEALQRGLKSTQVP
ncbi:MAG: hypothetical protein LBV30_08875, partial [Propionibacteriaceae bacterium]|nr:hypothetical protein [Propionibacteriaceae bacterium]